MEREQPAGSSGLPENTCFSPRPEKSSYLKLPVLAKVLGVPLLLALAIAACENATDDPTISYRVINGVGKVDSNCERFLDRLSLTYDEQVINEQGELTDEILKGILDRFGAERIRLTPDLSEEIMVEPEHRTPLFEALEEQIGHGVERVEEVPLSFSDIPIEELPGRCESFPLESTD